MARLAAEFPSDPSQRAPKISRNLSLAMVWNESMWLQHTNRWRYVTHLGMLRSATVTRAIWPLIAFAVAWALFARRLVQTGVTATLPVAPLTLSASSIGLLLVFRTNQAAARATEARKLLGVAKRRSVDVATYFATLPGTENGARLRAVAARYCALSLWALKGAVRPGDAAARAAGAALLDADELRWVRAHQRDDASRGVAPATVALRLRYALRDLPAEAAGARHHGERAVADLCLAFGGCARLYTTPIPPTYIRHVSRSLVAWLLLLPFATAPAHETAAGLALTTFLLAFLLLGIDEIGTQIEEPFSVLPLHELCLATSHAVAAVADGPPPPPLA